jgi:hypothetical protein
MEKVQGYNFQALAGSPTDPAPLIKLLLLNEQR